jgi:hypothetical protein
MDEELKREFDRIKGEIDLLLRHAQRNGLHFYMERAFRMEARLYEMWDDYQRHLDPRHGPAPS